MAWRRRSSRFGRTQRSPITETTVWVKKRTICKACSCGIEAGEQAIKLKLRKAYRVPCGSCGKKPVGSKKFHIKCRPTDFNKAMGFDPAKFTAAPPPVAPTHTVPPPPKPPSLREAQEAALLAFETALKRRIAENPALVKDAELEKTLKTYQGCKGRALRGSTDAEAMVGMKMALKRALDLVF